MARRANPGDHVHISARTWNRVLDGLERGGQKGGSIRQGVGPLDVLVQNGTGQDLPLYGVIGLTAPLVNPDVDEVFYYDAFAFVGAVPIALTYQYKWGIAQEPIAAAATGRVRVLGLSHCFISLSPSSNVQFAGPTDDGSIEVLTKADCGARVIYRHDGDGPQRAIVAL